jgi:hypothetical protein
MLTTDQGQLPVTDPVSRRLISLLTRKNLFEVWIPLTQSKGERRALTIISPAFALSLSLAQATKGLKLL